MNKNLGKLSKYEVDRETDLGYVLTDENDEEYFLHRNETNYRRLKAGEKVFAFLYTDKKSRLALTLYIPFVTVDKIGFATIQDVNKEIGAFLNIGISKDILLSKDDLPYDYHDWPKSGDKVCCSLKVRANRLVARICTKNEILSYSKQIDLPLEQKVQGYVYRITADGVNIVTESFDVVFVHQTNLRKKYRIGEMVDVKIIKKNENDYSGTLIDQKEVMIQEDKEIVLDYLKKNQGFMAITEKSDPAVIKRIFNMSKVAFKNALGKLYKEKQIEIHDDKIILL